MKPVLSALLVVGLMASSSVETAAQNMPMPLIAVLDVQGILKNSLAAKSIRPQVRKLRTAFQENVQRQRDELRKAEQTLAQQRTILSSEAYAGKRRDYESRARQAQRDVQAQKRTLDSAFGAAMERVRRSLIIVTQELAKERKVNIVLPKSVVLLSIKKLDITKQALKRLDKRLPAVKVVVKEKK